MTIRGKAVIAGAFGHRVRPAPDKSRAQLHAEFASGALAEAWRSLSDVDTCAEHAPGLRAIGTADCLGLKPRHVDSTEPRGSYCRVRELHAARAIARDTCGLAAIALEVQPRSPWRVAPKSGKGATVFGLASMLLALLALVPVPAAGGVIAPPPVASRANATGSYGLYRAADFTVAGDGSPTLSSVSRHAAWYFRDEIVAVPRAGLLVAGFEPGVRPFDDVRHWAGARAAGAAIEFPPLVWIAAPQVLRHARLVEGGSALAGDGGEMALNLVPRIALNRSYVDASSMAFFAGRELTLRGSVTDHGFVARTIWPEDFRFGPQAPPARTLSPAMQADALRALVREAPHGGAQSPYAAMTLWRRTGGSSADWAGRPVIGLMVNGAQGDDDEAHGGHFAIVTGRVQSDGGIGDWLVNNFYSLDVESEKGIIAAPVPLDNYLGDLNAGQGWYRPSVMLVAVLQDERASVLVQSALNRVFNQFYRHQLVYYHPNQNCASISVDTLRALGWNVTARGPTSRVLAWAAYPFIAAKELSISKARLAFDYLRTDQTRLLPAVALEEAFADLVALQERTAAPDGKLAQMLAEDVQALAFLRFPQFPSSRAFGDAAAVSTWEYRTRVPNDPALAQVVPVPPRPFPPALRDDDLLAPRWTPADYATLVWALVSGVGLAWLSRWGWKRWRPRRTSLPDA